MRSADNAEDLVANLLKNVQLGKPVEDKPIQDLKKRKLISPLITKYYSVTKGPQVSLSWILYLLKVTVRV